MSNIVLHEGDNRDSLRRLIDAGVRVHSVVTDPPYGLVSVTKRFGKDSAAPALSNGATGVFKRASGGFMGQQWDASGIERDPEFWRLIWEILLPGGYVLAFSGARTGHWQACAMEEAGFIMHPMIGWCYGSGFPKAHAATRGMQDHPDQQKWEGWAYGAQSLKPAFEPIYMGQKPFSEKNGALNLLKHGVGAVNIDGCRVPTTENLNGGAYAKNATPRDQMWGDEAGNSWKRGGAGEYQQPSGRHPANLLHDGSAEVIALFPDSKGQQAAVRGTEPSGKTDNCYGEFAGRTPAEPRGDSGSAARFFNSFPVDPNPLYYHAKASKADRAGSKHPTVKPVRLMEWLVTLVTPPGGTVLDPFGGSGTTGQAARNLGFDCILMEAEPQFITDIKNRFGLAGDDCDLFSEPSTFDDLFG